jgi:hypothetical protein
MSNQNITEIGEVDTLKRCCKNVIEMDLAKNQIDSWNEVWLSSHFSTTFSLRFVQGAF